MTTVPFYFKNRRQFSEIEELFRAYQNCKYAAGPSMGGIFSSWGYDLYYHGTIQSIPRDAVTDKRYLGVIILNYAVKPEYLPFDLYKELATIGVELIDKEHHNLPRGWIDHEGIDVLIQNINQFSGLCRNLDLAIGQGMWTIRQTNTRHKVRATERVLDSHPSFLFRRTGSYFKEETKEKIKKQGGIYLTFIVPKSFGEDKLMKLLFLSSLKAI